MFDTPRRLSSEESTSPDGPPPTIKTSVAWWCGADASARVLLSGRSAGEGEGAEQARLAKVPQGQGLGQVGGPPIIACIDKRKLRGRGALQRRQRARVSIPVGARVSV